MGKHWHKVADVRKLGRCLCQLCTFRGNALPSAGSGHEVRRATQAQHQHTANTAWKEFVSGCDSPSEENIIIIIMAKAPSFIRHAGRAHSLVFGLIVCICILVITSAVKRLVVINHILNKRFSLHYMWPWSTEAVISSTGIFVARLQYIVWLKIIHFYYMPNIIRY